MTKLRILLQTPWHLLLLVAGLISVGIVFITSSTQGSQHSSLPVRQLLAVAAAIPPFLVIACTPLRLVARAAYWCYALMMLCLLLVLFFGIEINSARRWFPGPFGFNIQPSELAKPVFIVALAKYLRFCDAPRTLGSLIRPALLLLIPFLLIRAEPDLGTAMMFLPIAAAQLFVAGARRVHFLAALVLVAVSVPLLLMSPILEDYQKERITAFRRSIPQLTTQARAQRRRGDVEEARQTEEMIRELKQDSAYQSYHALVAIGSGGVHGQGVGRGPQNRLRYLPERHNDFVFAVVGEEAGLIGCTVLIAAYVGLGLLTLSIGRSTRDRFGQLVAAGVGTALCVQASANIAMTIGLLPITGLPLPFLSHGGSSMLSSLIMVALSIAVVRSRHSTEPFWQPVPSTGGAFSMDREAGSRRRLLPR